MTAEHAPLGQPAERGRLERGEEGEPLQQGDGIAGG
jgi:hypothetical protein